MYFFFPFRTLCEELYLRANLGSCYQATTSCSAQIAVFLSHANHDYSCITQIELQISCFFLSCKPRRSKIQITVNQYIFCFATKHHSSFPPTSSAPFFADLIRAHHGDIYYIFASCKSRELFASKICVSACDTHTYIIILASCKSRAFYPFFC